MEAGGAAEVMLKPQTPKADNTILSVPPHDFKAEEERRAKGEGCKVLELIKSGDSAVLYDPGMLLLSAPLMMYVTESGEPYGNLEMDVVKTVREIREHLKKLGVSGISAIGGISSEKPEVIEAYREVLKGLAAEDLKVMKSGEVWTLKEERERAAADRAYEESGIRLEKKLSRIGKHYVDGGAVVSAMVSGLVTVPLTVREQRDCAALGLTEQEAEEIKGIEVRSEYEKEYNEILSNIYAAWGLYERSGVSKAETARFVNSYLCGEKEGLPLISGETTIGEIISGKGEASDKGITMYRSGIPGMFKEGDVVDFYEEAAAEKYLKGLERKHILPKGGAGNAMSAVKTLTVESSKAKKAEINRSLTRAFRQYKEISMSTGMPIKELVEAVKAAYGLSADKGVSVTGRKVHYELPFERLVEEAKKGVNLQRKEERVEEAEGLQEEVRVIIGGVSGRSLDEVMLTREKLISEYEFGEEEAGKAMKFLHSVRFTEGISVMPELLIESLNRSRGGSAKELRRNILGALEGNKAVAYNLYTSEGLQAYIESGRGRESKVSKKEIEALLEEGQSNVSTAAVLGREFSRIEPKYRAQMETVEINRNTPRGTPEKIRLLSGEEGSGYNLSPAFAVNAMLNRGSRQSRVIGPPWNRVLNESYRSGRGIDFGGIESVGFDIGTSGLSFEAAGSVEVSSGSGETGGYSGLRSHADGGSAADSLGISGGEIESSVSREKGGIKRSSGSGSKDRELERLRKVEENYEKDKKELSKREIPVLARSESREVGHAVGGEGENEVNPKRMNGKMRNMIKEELRNMSGGL